MDGLEAEFGEQMNFVRLDANVPENTALQQAYNLRGHPTVVILDETGAVQHRYFGPETAESLRRTIQNTLP